MLQRRRGRPSKEDTARKQLEKDAILAKLAGERKEIEGTAEARLARYKQEFELDDLNIVNDTASLKQMVELEIQLEKLSNVIKQMAPEDIADNYKAYKDLIAAQRDTTVSYVSIQRELGIARSKRKEDSDVSGAAYIEELKTRAKDFIDKKLVNIDCETCKLHLGKYVIHVITKGGEPGSIEAKTNPPVPIYFNMKLECPHCGKIVETSKLENKERD